MKASRRSATVAVLAAVSALALAAPAAPASAGSGKGGKSQGDPTAAAMEATKLGADLLARHKGATRDRIVSLMGAPAGTTTREGAERLTWASPGPPDQPGTVYCTATAEFLDGKLSGLTITGEPQYDRSICRKLVKPLLNASGPAAQAGSATSAMTLTNDGIVDLVKGGLPTEAIIARVRTYPCKFDLSNEATIALRRAGVNEAILAAMTDRKCD